MSDNNERLWEKSLPIAAWPEEKFNFENGQEVFDVEGAVKAINAAPEQFRFAILNRTQAEELVRRNGSTAPEPMSRDDMERPVLIATTPTGHRLIDGNKRAAAAMLAGAPGLGAWMLSAEETQRFTVPSTR